MKKKEIARMQFSFMTVRTVDGTLKCMMQRNCLNSGISDYRGQHSKNLTFTKKNFKK